jgi:molybdenum cofactor biosynthesis enzyme MoaA
MAVTLDATRVPCPHAFNAVALRGCNEDEIPDLVRWSHGRAFDLTLIETVPTGEIDADRRDQYLPLPLVRARLEQRPRSTISLASRGGRRAMGTSARQAADTASSRRSLTISARRATGFGSLHRHTLYVSIAQAFGAGR